MTPKDDTERRIAELAIEIRDLHHLNEKVSNKRALDGNESEARQNEVDKHLIDYRLSAAKAELQSLRDKAVSIWTTVKP